MATLTEKAASAIHAATSSTTAETWGLTRKCKSVRVTNRDTDPIFVTIKTFTEFVDDDTGLVTAVADADETIVVPGVATNGGYQTREIWRSPRARYVKGSIIGNASTYDIEGFDWY